MQVRVTLRKPGSKLEHLGLTAELIGDIGQCSPSQPPNTSQFTRTRGGVYQGLEPR